MNATKPIRPELPAHVRSEISEMNRADRALRTGDPRTFGEAVESIIGMLTRPKTQAEIAAEAEYERQRLVWNAYVNAQRVEAQARRNAREVTAIRNAACPRCFATHAGEC